MYVMASNTHNTTYPYTNGNLDHLDNLATTAPLEMLCDDSTKLCVIHWITKRVIHNIAKGDGLIHTQ
jgi:hypothetical protein